MSTHDEVTELASRVITRLTQGLLVRTQESRFRSTTPDDDVMRRIELRAGVDLSVVRRSAAVDVKSTYHIDALASGEEGQADDGDPRDGWSCSVTIHGQWPVDGAADLSDESIKAFAARVGVMTLHPYARAHVQAAVSASGWPPFTMDVLTAHDELFRSEELPGEVDLSLIALETS